MQPLGKKLLIITNPPPKNKKKPPGKSFLFPKQFDHTPHVHLCVLPHHVQDLFWWAVDVEGYFNIVFTLILINGLSDQYDDYENDDIEKKRNYVVILGLVK